jgi:hypothetical protein
MTTTTANTPADTTSTDATATGADATTTTGTSSTDAGADLAAEVEKWKQHARKHEERAKANANAARELDQLRQSSMSDQEKAVEAARAEGRALAMREAASSLIDAEVRLHATGRSIDVDTLLDGLDRARFVDATTGQPDRAAIKAWVEKVAPAGTAAQPDLGQGARGGQPMALNGDPLVKALKDAVGIR